ncbi:hypothetical protein [Bradyrhizobium neotropicale]|uniref:hypothetical protein n=1 Tax=Bradyrhizobium neotropicale TaxID=1497615 RepID=UPI000B322757|nr:hypothetical protein [Bradyrhizobium neotropicale]
MAAMDSVAIVGADPVELVIASALARAEVLVAIFERGREIVSSLRAITYRWSARLGLLEDALALEFTKQGYTYLAQRSGILSLTLSSVSKSRSRPKLL